MNKQTVVLFIAAWIAMAGGVYFGGLSSFNKKAPLIEFSLPDVMGKMHSISEWQGKIRIINFWATWCAPCLEEIPVFIKLQDEYEKQDIQFIGVAIDNQKAVTKYLNTININYPILIGEDQAISLSYQLGNLIKAVPFTLIISAKGDVVHRQLGEISRQKIIEIITPLL